MLRQLSSLTNCFLSHIVNSCIIVIYNKTFTLWSSCLGTPEQRSLNLYTYKYFINLIIIIILCLVTLLEKSSCFGHFCLVVVTTPLSVQTCFTMFTQSGNNDNNNNNQSFNINNMQYIFRYENTSGNVTWAHASKIVPSNLYVLCRVHIEQHYFPLIFQAAP